ncbi:Protein of unknown function precursor [Flavobacterium indicum GPTSA100-9 = DSM 17447]|uniref:Lipoprotein n=1 Tax=Flavobacterium indicum (strain DSM 17447 / CIP 109464 / GPTSA100-9) TaxID=1094466 RepID=H8XPC1_FLAIG|nr:hypothetical protein [Flavobacterium indicum]CCG53195.1 Protein of unknown function precursor [Flavobacterium indicum GPTSA100-9 = DSM 17447]
MKQIVVFFILFSSVSFGQITGVPHCGYDFTSYVVVNAHEENQKVNVKDLKISLVDLDGNEVLNTNNAISLVNNNLPLLFTQNYQITLENNQQRWYFPYATDQYFLVVRNTISIEDYQIKIEDTKGKYQTQIVPLSSLNLYILCSTEAEKQARTFGPKTSNQMVEVVLTKI